MYLHSSEKYYPGQRELFFFGQDFLQMKVVCPKAWVITKAEYNTVCGEFFLFHTRSRFLI